MIGGRAAVLIAVSLQAAGKVAYGTWLGPVPAPLFVFVSFTLAASRIIRASWLGHKRAPRSVTLHNVEIEDGSLAATRERFA